MNIIDHIYLQSPWLRDQGYRPSETRLPRRNLYSAFYEYITNTKQITSLIGMRRVGKSTLMKQCIGELLSKETAASSILYFSFDQPTVIHEAEALEEVITHFVTQIMGENISTITQTVYLFLDEIQLVPYWQDVVKRFYDTNKHLKFIVSGSASLFVGAKSKESLAGRIFEFVLPPLAFSEYQVLSGKNDMEEFLSVGQFPELFELPNIDRKKEYLTSIISKVLEVDVVDTYGIRKVADFERLFWTLLPNTGQIVVSRKLISDIGMKKATLFHYLKILEGSLLVCKVVNRAGSFRSESRLLRKLYPGSSNFLTLSVDPVSVGFKAETYVASLISIVEKPYLYHQRGKEIDFFLPNHRIAIEVKYQEHIHPSDYQLLFSYAQEKNYQVVLVTKSYNAPVTHTTPECVSLDRFEEYVHRLIPQSRK